MEELQIPVKKPLGKRRAPVVESEIRRSPRLKTVYNGSKPSVCSDRRCLACSPSPPTLSTKLIRNLGVQFCEMNPELLEDAVLKKGKKNQLVSKKKKAADPNHQESSTGGKKNQDQPDDKGRRPDDKRPEENC